MLRQFAALAIILGVFSVSAPASAAVTFYSNEAAFLAASKSPLQSVDFTRDDAGNPITSPSADVLFPCLSLSGACFQDVRSYWNQGIYTFPKQELRVDLSPGVTAIAAQIHSFYTVPAGTPYTITLSSGEVYQFGTDSAGGGTWTPDFIGIVSDSPIQWATFRLDATYLFMSKFTFTVPSMKVCNCPNSCHYFSPSVNPTTVVRGGTVTVAGMLQSCASVPQTISALFRASGPAGEACRNSVAAGSLPPITLLPGYRQTITFPLTVPADACPGPYSFDAIMYRNGVPVDKSAASLRVSP
jgi:hypothetical protein